MEVALPQNTKLPQLSDLLPWMFDPDKYIAYMAEEHYGDLLTLARKFVSIYRMWDVDPDDLVQEAFVLAHRSVRARQTVPRIDPLGWFKAVVWNTGVTTYRKRKQRLQMEVVLDFDLVGDSPATNPEAQAEIHELQTMFEFALFTSGPARYRLCLDLLVDGVDKDEICSALRVSKETLRVLIHRARQSFIRANERDKSPFYQRVHVGWLERGSRMAPVT
jgi:RNA polymerase sigma factor (sigma-70 family)